ncbi:DNA invertase Pin-like site-specific DNA recombinase [Larkinella arboricola]|uniref:DNA invertase Pin-like site-specific DNA recombinase n=1 Tax=Larkinella arboricola TaxID=643671 RepID=A0A327WEA8_LARAB|nr:recombinase family protein [Larkinella arboricola]RAJ89176.1 DNA invertase Pin-like site-specific DNA recombinase [Larkinella arboricola]
MKIGYARVSTQDQNLELQIDALEKAGCERIYKEKVSGAKRDRQQLEKMLSELRKGDEVYIFKLDRLGRSMKDLLELVNQLQQNGVDLISLQDQINTTTAQGRLTFNIFASLAEFERDLIIERTTAGLKSARARGRVGGRPRGLSDEAQRTAMIAATLYNEQQLGVNELAKRLKISKATLYKYLRHRGVEINSSQKPKQ